MKKETRLILILSFLFFSPFLYGMQKDSKNMKLSKLTSIVIGTKEEDPTAVANRNGSKVVTLSEGLLKRFDLTSKKKETEVTKTNFYKILALSSCGNMVIAMAKTDEAYLYDLLEEKIVYQLDKNSIDSAEFSRDDKKILAIGTNGRNKKVIVLDTKSGEELNNYIQRSIDSCHFDSKAEKIIVGSSNSVIILCPTGNRKIELGNLATGNKRRTSLLDNAFCATQKRENTITLLDIHNDTHKQVRNMYIDNIKSIFPSDNSFVIASGRFPYIGQTFTILPLDPKVKAYSSTDLKGSIVCYLPKQQIIVTYNKDSFGSQGKLPKLLFYKLPVKNTRA